MFTLLSFSNIKAIWVMSSADESADEPATFQLGIILSLGPGRWVVPPCADKDKNSFITLVWWSGLVACQSLSGQGAELHQETIRYLTHSLTSSLSLSSLSDFETVLSLLLSRTLARFLARTLARSLTRTHARTQVDYFRDFLVMGRLQRECRNSLLSRIWSHQEGCCLWLEIRTVRRLLLELSLRRHYHPH